MFLQIAAIALTAVSPAVSPVSSSAAAALPEAPMVVATSQIHMQEKKHNFDKYDYALYTGVVLYRVGDYVTTERGLAHGGKEYELPAALVANKPAFAAYSAGMAFAEIEGSIYLHRHGHPVLARIADSISVSTGLATDTRNGFVHRLHKK